jgi:peptidoglycan/LPS O-acetylase OafA/YrhL
MKNRIVGGYTIFIGISVIAMWIMILYGPALHEGKIELGFHLFSEFLMSIICIVSGIRLWLNKPGAKILNVCGLGMVIYSVLNAAGYYGHKGETAMLLMFIILTILIASAVILLTVNNKLSNNND